MKNIPSVVKEMPIAAAHPETGKRTQPERLLPVMSGGGDFSVSPTNTDSPETFQCLLQKKLQDPHQKRFHKTSSGLDCKFEAQDVINAQMMGTGTKTELHNSAGDEPLSDTERLISAPDIRGTAKKKKAKGQSSVSATNFIITSATIAPANGYRDNPSPDASVGTRRRSDRHQDVRGESKTAATGVAPLPLGTAFEKRAQGAATTEDTLPPPNAPDTATTVFAPMSVGAEDGEILLSRRGGQAASGQAEESVRSNNRPLDGRAVFAETDIVLGGSKGAAARVSHSLPKANAVECLSPLMTGEKVMVSLTATGMQTADAVSDEVGSDGAEKISPRGGRQDVSGKVEGPVFFHHKHTGKEPAHADGGDGPNGHTAAVETGSSGNKEPMGTPGDSTRAGHGGGSGQDSERKWAISGISSSSLRTSLGERVHSLMTSENVAPAPSAFTATVAGIVPISSGFDTGSVTSSAGQQSVLITQVVDAAQPLMQHGGGRVLISLNPPSLGALDIDVRVKRDNVELYVVANNQDVQQTLCSHVEQLRKALIDQGLNMDRFQVVVGDRSGGQQGRDPRQEGMSGWQGESRSNRGYHPEADGENASDGMRKPVRSDAYQSIGGINLFI